MWHTLHQSISLTGVEWIRLIRTHDESLHKNASSLTDSILMNCKYFIYAKQNEMKERKNNDKKK